MKNISELTDAEANQLLHESRLVGKCWHTWKPAIDPSNPSLLGVRGCECGEYTCYSEVKDGGPDYAQSWDAIIPVIQALDDSSIIKELNKMWSHCSFYGMFNGTKPRHPLNSLLQLVRDGK